MPSIVKTKRKCRNVMTLSKKTKSGELPDTKKICEKNAAKDDQLSLTIGCDTMPHVCQPVQSPQEECQQQQAANALLDTSELYFIVCEDFDDPMQFDAISDGIDNLANTLPMIDCLSGIPPAVPPLSPTPLPEPPQSPIPTPEPPRSPTPLLELPQSPFPLPGQPHLQTIQQYKTVMLHRVLIQKGLLEIFTQEFIIDDVLKVYFIDEAGSDASGPSRDAYCAFRK